MEDKTQKQDNTAKQISSVITILIITPMNFIVNKYWAYKK